MTKSKILKRLAKFAPPIINETCKPGPHCILSSAVGQMVLERLGVLCVPYSAEIFMCNKAWIEWSKFDFEGGKEAQLERGAYMISNRPHFTGEQAPSLNPVTGPAWDGHLALRSGEWLIDLDLGNFSRPTKNIWLPPSFVAPLDENNTIEGEYHVDQHMVFVRYAPMVAPFADDYVNSKDWTLRDRYEDRVVAIVKKIREGE
jgi:hypothetical protein